MKGYLFITGAFFVWSTWGITVRWLGLPAAEIIFFNALFATILQGGWLAFRGRREGARMMPDLIPAIWLGLFGLVNLLSFLYALKVTTVAAALLTHYVAPVLVAVLAPLTVKDRVGRGTLAALAVAAAGLVFIFAGGLDFSDGNGMIGAASGTLSGLAYAGVILFSRALSGRNHPLKLSLVQAVLTVVLVGALIPWLKFQTPALSQLSVIALTALFHSTLANASYLKGIRSVTAQEAGVLGYLEPVLGITLAFVFLGEVPYPIALVGGALIIGSGISVIYRGSRGARSTGGVL
ncbi:MAG: DMT family transporter [Nitrospirota bacterium]